MFSLYQLINVISILQPAPSPIFSASKTPHHTLLCLTFTQSPFCFRIYTLYTSARIVYRLINPSALSTLLSLCYICAYTQHTQTQSLQHNKGSRVFHWTAQTITDKTKHNNSKQRAERRRLEDGMKGNRKTQI